MTHWNRLFWAVFILLGIIVIAGAVARILYLDLIFGLFVVGIGAAKLGEEINHRRLQHRHRAMNESISYLTGKVDSAASAAEHAKDSSESRLFHVDRKLSEMSQKAENRFDEAVKKVISLENRLNDQSRLMLELARRQEAMKAAEERRAGHAVAQAARPVAAEPPIAPERRIMRFDLPKIAPRMAKAMKARAKPRKKAGTRRRRPRAVAVGKTIINIQAPRPQVIKKIVRARPKKRARKKARARPARKKTRIKLGGSSTRTTINIIAPRQRAARKAAVRRPPKRKARRAPKALKTRVAKKVRKTGKPRKLRKVELLLRET